MSNPADLYGITVQSIRKSAQWHWHPDTNGHCHDTIKASWQSNHYILLIEYPGDKGRLTQVEIPLDATLQLAAEAAKRLQLEHARQISQLKQQHATELAAIRQLYPAQPSQEPSYAAAPTQPQLD